MPPISAPNLLPSEAVLACLGRGCLGGGVAVLLAWAACRIFPQMPARVRFGFWWIACAKLMLGVFCAGFVPFFVPMRGLSETVPARSLRAAYFVVAPAPKAATKPAAVRLASPMPTMPPAAAKAQKAEDAGDAAASETELPTGASAEPAAPDSKTPPLLARLLRLLVRNGADALFAAYFVGLCFVVARGVRAAQTGRRVVRWSRAVQDAQTLEAAAQVAFALWGKTKTVRVLESGEVVSPFVAGFFRPVLVLPEDLARSITKQQLYLILAHEMAHLRRGDLWTGAVCQAAQKLLWFFPIAHFACRETMECAEEACDARALSVCPEAGRSEMGDLLLRFSLGAAGQNTPAPMLGMAAAPGFARLRRRLWALQAASPMGWPAKIGAFVMAIFVGGSVLPWRVANAARASSENTLPALSPEAALRVALSAGVEGAKTGTPHYEIVDLGADNETYSDAYAISDSGVVVGTTGSGATNGRGVGFVYRASENKRDDIGAAPYRRSVASAVSAGGTVAAWGFNRRNRPQAFVWRGTDNTAAQTGRVFLKPLAGFRYGQASGVNGREIVGASHGLAKNGIIPSRAFSFAGGSLHDLGTLGGPNSWALAVSETGLVVGKADAARGRRQDAETHAFAVQTGPDGAATETMRDLGTLPGGKNSRAQAVSASGKVVGFAQVGKNRHAFLVDKNGGAMRDLGTIPGKTDSAAYGISDAGIIVGAASEKAGGRGSRKTNDSAAVVWVQNGAGDTVPVDLNACIAPDAPWTLTAARGVNNRGWIVGQGRVHGKMRAFLLKPL